MDMLKFSSWFGTKLTIGAMPFLVNIVFDINAYDIIINVSDEFYPSNELLYYRKGIVSHWFPMSEQKRDIGLNSIFAAIIIMWHAEQENKRVYLHCHSGSNRSWTVAATYYYYRSGSHMTKPTRNGHLNKLLQNCAEAYLPPVGEMEAWIKAVRKDFDDGKMKAGILTLSKINTLVNF